MADHMAMGIIVIHEDLKKIIGLGSPCILRPNSMGEMIDQRRRLVYKEDLRRTFYDRCRTKGFDDRCFVKDDWRGMFSEG